MLLQPYLYTGEKDLGTNVGIITQNRINCILNRDKNRKHKELTLKYWIELKDDIEIAFIHYRMSCVYSKYLVSGLTHHDLREFRINELREELFYKREIRKCDNYSETNFNKNFYIFKGYTEEEAKNANYKVQSKNSKASAAQITPEKRTTNIEYWLKQGFNEEEAKLKLKERQSTFSLEKCIAKHGEEKGLEVFNARQQKWQETLNSRSKEEIDDANTRKSIYKKHKGENKEDFFNRVTKVFIKHYEDEMRTKGTFYSLKFEELKNLYCSIDFLRNSVLENYRNNKFSHSFFSPLDYYNKQNSIFKSVVEFDDIKECLNKYYSKKNIIKLKFNYVMRTEFGLLRSSNEIEFYLGLVSLDIPFILDKCYKDSDLRFDFYLPETDTYIEIAGMMGKESYRKKMEFKNKEFNSVILEPANIQEFLEELKKEKDAKNKY